MKKLILLTGVIVMMYAGSAFAGTGTATTVGSGFVSGFNLSKNVGAAYNSTSSATAGYYTMGTKHTSGDAIFGGTSTDTAMYKKAGAAGTPCASGDTPTLPTAAGQSAAASGWTSM